MRKEYEETTIVDLHCHMMPEVDDGSESLDMTMEMIRMSYEQGVRAIFLTSHSWGIEGNRERYLANYKKIVEISKEKFLDMTFYVGTEIECDSLGMEHIIRKLSDGTYFTLNKSRYVLAEFYGLSRRKVEMKRCLQQLIDNGFIPVIAHVERYSYMLSNGIEDVRELKNMGCLVQINLFSIEEEKDQKIKLFANKLLDEKLVDFVGTDAHRSYHRPPKVSTGIKTIMERCDSDYARDIIGENARKLMKI